MENRADHSRQYQVPPPQVVSFLMRTTIKSQVFDALLIVCQKYLTPSPSPICTYVKLIVSALPLLLTLEPTDAHWATLLLPSLYTFDFVELFVESIKPHKLYSRCQIKLYTIYLLSAEVFFVTPQPFQPTTFCIVSFVSGGIQNASKV